MSTYLERRIPDFRSFTSSRLGFAAHLHRHVELVLFLQGSATAYVEAQRYRLSPGDAFLVFPNQVHRYDAPTGVERSHLLIVLPDMMPDLADTFLSLVPKSPHLVGVVTDELLTIACRLEGLRHPQTLLEHAERRGLLTALFSRILRACELSEHLPNERNTTKAVVDFCTKHYTEDLSLAVLERELHLSRYYISHLFTKKLQIGFNDYLNSLRTEHACRLLCEQEHSVTEIGTLSGFSNPRTFNRAFLKQTGMTPSEYRKKGRMT
jgi:AraC-like DNA-binding protein